MIVKLEKKLVTCKKCGYSWNTRSGRRYVNCPACGSSVKIRSIEEVKKIIKELNNKKEVEKTDLNKTS